MAPYSQQPVSTMVDLQFLSLENTQSHPVYVYSLILTCLQCHLSYPSFARFCFSLAYFSEFVLKRGSQC